MKKKIIISVFAFAFLFVGLAGCGNTNFMAKYGTNITEYNINFKLNEDKTINGQQNVRYKNTSSVILNEVYFHLYANSFSSSATNKPVSKIYESKAYPNGKSYGGIEILSVKCGNEETSHALENTDKDLLKVVLLKPLYPNEIVNINIDYKVTIPNVLHRFGWNDNTINLGNIYPIACVFEDGKWDKNPYSANGDPFYSNFANYNVEITYPEKYVLAHTGNEVDSYTTTVSTESQNAENSQNANRKFVFETDILINENNSQNEAEKNSLKANSPTISNSNLNKNENDSQLNHISKIGTNENISHLNETGKQKYNASQKNATEEINDNNSQITSDGKIKTTKINATAVRDFAMVLSDKFKVLNCTVNETEINYYYHSDERAEDSLQTAKKALTTFNESFGLYPYKQLSVVETGFIYGGMEYPNLVMISDSLEKYDDYTNTIVHEIAHQWWYGVVGNNEYDHGWLDESLTEYSCVIFYEKNPEYEIKREVCIQNAITSYTTFVDVYEDIFDKVDTSMNRSLDEYNTEPEYVYVAYVKGMIMYDDIRNIIGDKAFFKSLRSYYKNYSGKNATPDDLINTFEDCSNRKLRSFINGYLDGTCIIGKLEESQSN